MSVLKSKRNDYNDNNGICSWKPRDDFFHKYLITGFDKITRHNSSSLF